MFFSKEAPSHHSRTTKWREQQHRPADKFIIALLLLHPYLDQHLTNGVKFQAFKEPQSLHILGSYTENIHIADIPSDLLIVELKDSRCLKYLSHLQQLWELFQRIPGVSEKMRFHKRQKHCNLEK